jgi:hypothetical protein
MYWYMTTTASSRTLLTDATWAQIPRAHADRRAIGAALLVLMLLLAAIILGNTTGILVPRLTYEGGSSTADAHTHTFTVRAIIHSNSSRSWKIAGATINAPGTVHEIQTTPVSIPAHQTRTVVGVVHVDNCAAIPSAPSNQTNPQTNPSHDLELRVGRLLGVTTVTIHGLSDDQLRVACGG